ncbi:uncharacterized protein LOC133913172 [Phragmites australis]|uniref:uncharacterized protein LOC133913172 n=1 Tax=Phragmites australis TaxID=29695 RepID=UPI002D78239C|nr:uncharacterized protein LOC133913172 [Phragmites australis]
MDNLDILRVRFHFGGEFDFNGHSLLYVGGRSAMSYLERDKVSLPELRGYLTDHIGLTDEDQVTFHWLFPGKELSNGLRNLNDDKSCIYMSDSISEGGVADIYVEVFKDFPDDNVVMSAGTPACVMCKEPRRKLVFVSSPSKEQSNKNVMKLKAFYSSPGKSTGHKYTSNGNEEDASDDEVSESDDDQEGAHGDEGSESDDSDYIQGDEDTSEEDEEAVQMRQHAKEARKNPSTVVTPIPEALVHPDEDDEALALCDDTEPAYMDSSEEASYDDAEEGESVRRKSRFPKFDNKAPIPKFVVDMAFRGRTKFKEALIKYRLAVRRHLRFPKDERARIRARCSWSDCQWMIYGSKRTNSDWFQVRSFNDVHTCPKRRDNRLVTARRIADRYEHIIKANPSWKLQNIKDTVFFEMFANVSLSKIKRAKGIVMTRVYESAKGEYSKVFEYQVEILRTNPGSTVVVCLDPDYSEPVLSENLCLF